MLFTSILPVLFWFRSKVTAFAGRADSYSNITTLTNEPQTRSLKKYRARGSEPVEVLDLAHKSNDTSLPQTRSHVSRAKESSCQGRLCTLDLSMIDPSAKEISFEVGSTGISTIDQSSIEAAATAGLDVTRFKTFRSSAKSTRTGYLNGESEFSYLNLLQQGTGPSGTKLWFGTMYDSDNDVYYDISPDATGTSILTYATHGSERPLPTGRKIPVSKNSDTTRRLELPQGHRQLVDDGSIIDIMIVWTLNAECKASFLNYNCAVTSQTETNMRGKIDAMIAASNEAYVNSGIQTELRLVYAYRHPTYKLDETNCNITLEHLTNKTDGQLDDVHSYRSQYRADMVQMITAPCDYYCGIAWVGGDINFAFSIVTSNCLEIFTSAHELGHNMVRWKKCYFYFFIFLSK
jgi:hypothetical protein